MTRRACAMAILLCALATARPLAHWPVALTNLRFTHLSVEDGLSLSIVRHVLQDHRGFIWVATHDGLNRYDGYRFTTFKHDPDDDNSLPSNFITSLAESVDRQSATLWIGTNRGLASYDAARNRFTRYRHTPATADTLSSDSIQALLVDRRGAIWIGHKRGLDRFDPLTNSVTSYAASDGVDRITAEVTSLAEEPGGAIWVGTIAGLNRVDVDTGRITRFVHRPDDPRSLADNHVRSLLWDRHGRLWIGTDTGGLDRLDPGGRFAHHVHSSDPASVSGNSINALLEDRNGTLWVGVWGGGINQLVPGAAGDGEVDPPARFVAYRHDTADGNSLVVDDVNTLAQDRSGAIWVGTYGGGLSRFNVPSAISHFKRVSTRQGTLIDNRVYALLVDARETLWVGTWGGLNRLPAGADRFDVFPVRSRDGRGLSDARITWIAESPQTLWVGTLDGGLNAIDLRTDRVRHYRHDPQRPTSLSSDRVSAVHVDRRGVLWIGTLNAGLNRFDAATQTFERYPYNTANRDGISNERVTTIADDRAGRLWIGTYEGLNVLDPSSGRITSLRTPELSGTILSIAEGRDGEIWVGTAMSGLVRVESSDNPASARVRSYRERDGFPNDHIAQVLIDDDGQIWASTNNGIVRLDPRTNSTSHLDVTHGLQANEFRPSGFFDRRTGRMYFGGINGFNVFRPADVSVDSYLPPVALTSFTIRNLPVAIGGGSPLARDISDTESLTLSYRDEVFAVEFAALQYTAPEKTRYAYMLEGFDPEWSYTDASRRSATYTNLAPGNYRFLVKATNRDGRWNDTPRVLAITILPPFWMTWWFRILAALTVVATTIAIHLTRVRTIERQRQELEEVVAIRTRELREQKERAEEANRRAIAARQVAESANAAKTTFLTNISHEIRTPLNAIVGMAATLSHTPLTAEQREYANALKAGGEALSELINDTLDLSKIEVGRLELELTTFDPRKLVSDVVSLIQVRAREKGLGVTCTISPEVPQHVSGDASALRRVLINLLGNAVKFTESGSITVSVGLPAPQAQTPDAVLFAVSDTGIGIAAAKHQMIFEPFSQADVSISRKYGGTGLGLAISRQLVELMGGQIWLSSAPGEGSTFLFTAVLPAAIPGAPLPGSADAGGDESAFAVAPLRILLVDDSPHNRMVVFAYLKHLPDRIEVAENGAIAVARFQAHAYDVVLMDVNMPVMDGYQATKAIRQLERDQGRPHTPIIALTAHAFEEDAANSRDAGCDAHLTKPLTRQVLLEALAQYRATL